METLDTQLMIKILDKMGPTDLLVARRLSKGWEAAVESILKRKPTLKIQFQQKARLNDWLLTYGPPRFPPMKILPLLVVILTPAEIKLERLQKFGERNADAIRFLTINVPNEPEPWETVKAKALLSHCVNLEHLTIQNLFLWRGRGQQPADELLEVAADLPQFEKLRRLTVLCRTSPIEFLQEILNKAPKLEVVDLYLAEQNPLPTVTPKFLKTFEAFRIHHLALVLSLNDIPGEMTLLKELIQLDLKPAKLQIYLQLNNELVTEDAREEALQAGKKMFRDWLAKMCQLDTLTELTLHACGCPTQWDFPMPHVVTFELRTIDLNTMINPHQVPNLETFVSGGGVTLNPTKVFTTVRKLVTDRPWIYDSEFENSSRLPASYLWSNLFPNLTILETFIWHGNEDYLVPVLRHMSNLTQLKVTFDLNPRPTYDAGPLWDILTGGIRPILDESMQLANPGYFWTFYQNGRDSRRQNTSLGKLRNLKFLELMDVIPCIFLAVVQLTLDDNLSRLEILKMSMDAQVKDFSVNGTCVKILKRGHEYVDLRRISVKEEERQENNDNLNGDLDLN